MHLATDTIDLAGLAGHPTVGQVVLRSAKPIDLRSIPASLALAELAEEPLQERKLYFSFDKAYEKRRPTFQDALDWAEKLTGNVADIVTIKGGFKPRRNR